MRTDRNPPLAKVGRRVLSIHLTLWAGLCGFHAGCHRPVEETAAHRVEATALPAAQEMDTERVEKHNRGVALMGQFQYGQAHDLFQELVRQYPEWLDARVDLAIATLNRRQIGDAEQAEQLLEEVLQKEPNHLRAHYCRGILAVDRGDPEAALVEFQRVADADPSDAYAVYYAGQSLVQLSRAEEAVAHFERAITIDPYLRSAYYAAFQSCLRLRDGDRAKAFREQFSRLEHNPQARLAEMKYTRMGEKAEVAPIVAASPHQLTRPSGPWFAPEESLPLDSAEPIEWAASDARSPNLTACDIDQDGRVDLFMTQSSEKLETANLVMLSGPDVYRLQPNHPLTQVPSVNAAAWGDYDNDGLVDVYLCRPGRNQLWRQTQPGQWQDVTQASQAAGPDCETRDAAFFDADHDGDLDLFLVNDGPNELLSNNLDGTFRPLAQEQGLAGQGGDSRLIVAWDFDSDRDLDLLVLNRQPPHEVYRNDRLWSYAPAEGFDALRQAPLQAAVAIDQEADGRWELLTLEEGRLTVWESGTDGRWVRRDKPLHDPAAGPLSSPIAACDLNGDGVLDFLASGTVGWIAIDGQTREVSFRIEEPLTAWRVVQEQDAHGPSVVAIRPGAAPSIWRPGSGRFPYLSLQFTGKEDRAEQMRSNRSGLGVQAAARIGTHWTAFQTLRSDSGPGQSLQPVALGTRGADRLDFVRMTWPDGLFQTELNLDAGKPHQIEEIQRQVSSCPVVFAWNGESFQFVTDVLGAGGLGFNLGRGDYSPPRPKENLLLPEGLLQPRTDRWSIRISEPMEELCYLDAVRLVSYELPPGWNVVLDERFAASDPPPTGEPRFYRREFLPVAAKNDRGNDVLPQLLDADFNAAPPGAPDRRFIGRTAQPHSLTLTFAEPIDYEEAYLVMDGWIEYPYSQTMFAAWQANASYDAPTIEAEDSTGRWQVVCEQFGYPAGMPRQSAVPLSHKRLPAGTRRLRISTNLEIYWDRLAVIVAEQPPTVRSQSHELLEATVCESGFAHRITYPQRRPDYRYEQRVPLWDTRHPRGNYTAWGPALPLLTEVDDAVAILGPGEEVQLEFAAGQPIAENQGPRRWVLEFHGWCKDMDLYTRDGETVAPLPRRNESSHALDGERERLHQQFNHRYEDGT